MIKHLSFTGFFLLLFWGICCAQQVVVYTSVDNIFSEPILRHFEQETGIKVSALYDVEASKTVGLVNRLIAEKKRPKADVFWNSEVTRTIQLKQEGVLTPYRSVHWESFPDIFKDRQYYWTGFAARARVLIYNTKLIEEQDVPDSIFEFTKPIWREKITMAYPLFGTTNMHVAALYSLIGKEKTEAYLNGLAANNILIVNGNSVTRDLVVEGKIPIGFTDTDDANVAIMKGETVKIVYPDKNGLGTLLIPNTVALVRNGPNPENGKRLIDYLLSKETESRLAMGESAQMPLRSGVKRPAHMPDYSQIKAMEVDYMEVARYTEQASRFCQDILAP